MTDSEHKRRVASLERETRILRQKLLRSQANRVMLEEILDTHSNALIMRNAELEESREMIRQSEARYRELAHQDMLTGLPNRAYFYERFYEVLRLAKRSGACVALLYLDLDRFKEINDRFGHQAGDVVLRQAAGRLLSCVRYKDIAARIGGDEFAILIIDVAQSDDIIYIINRITSEVTKPYYVENVPCEIGVSIGVSIFPDNDRDAERLLQKADVAMYSAKKDSSKNYCFYHEIAE